MPFVFSDDGITVVPTGSLGVAFRNEGETLPDTMAIRATNSLDVETNFTDLALVSETTDGWLYIELTTPLAFGETYVVEVLFDSVVVHTETVEVASPGKRRSRVLRQRIYERLLTGHMAGNVAAKPYGDGHLPASINNDFKSDDGTTVEVGAAYIDGLERADYKNQTASVTVPLNFYGAIDDSEDTEDITGDAEELMGYLLATEWNLSRFGVNPTGAVFQAGAPEINDDRKMAVIRGNLTIPMRAVI